MSGELARPSLVLALIESGAGGSQKYYTNSNTGSMLDGALRSELANITINRIRVRDSGDRVQLNRSGAGSLSGLFGAGGVYENAMMDIQTEDGLAFAPRGANGGSFVNFTGMDDNSIASGIGNGERFILAIYYPTPQGLLKWGATDRLLWGADQVTWM